MALDMIIIGIIVAFLSVFGVGGDLLLNHMERRPNSKSTLSRIGSKFLLRNNKEGKMARFTDYLR